MPGVNPAIIFLHGLGSASSADFPLIARTECFSRYRCILPDFFGFGFSDRPRNFDYSLESHAETIHMILRHLNTSGVYLFGHSMGGTIAIALASAHPELICRLVIAEANLDPGIGQGSKIIANQSEGFYVAEGHRQYIENMKKSIPKIKKEPTRTPPKNSECAIFSPIFFYQNFLQLYHKI